MPQADGLAPVLHVELVFALGCQMAPWLGLAAVVAVLVMVATAVVVLVRSRGKAVAVPVYYAVLYLAPSWAGRRLHCLGSAAARCSATA